MNTCSKSLTGFATLLLAGAPALADDVDCPPALGAVTVDGNVLVAAPCRLDGTTVKGNVHLYAGGSLIANEADIDGNIQAENADFIEVVNSAIGGSIQLDNLVGDRSTMERNEIGGSIQLKENRSRLEVLDNAVGADIQAFSNSGGVVIADNVVDGNLQCKSNDPAPIGGNNRVSGNKEDQCAELSAASGSGDTTGGSSSAATGEPAAAGEPSGGGAVGLLFPAIVVSALSLLRARRRSAGVA